MRSFIHTKIKKIIALGVMVLQLQHAIAQTKHFPRSTDKSFHSVEPALPLDPEVRYGKLPNGFTYYIRHNEEPKARVSMYLVNKVGSILEDEDQLGLAHFMEHMSFNGTIHFPHNQLEDYLQKAGVRFGADLNAYTGFDETVYELPIPSDKPEVLNSGIRIMRDWAHEALLDPTEIDKERGVVLEEKRLGKGAAERMRRLYFPVILNGSRYADRLPIGVDKVLDNFKRPAIARFYKDWYRPDLQALIVVGDINVDEIEKQVKAKFGTLKNPIHERPRIGYRIALTGKNQYLALTDKEQANTEVQIIFKLPEMKLQTATDLRKYVLRSLFNKMLSERFTDLTLSPEPPFLACQASISGFLGGLDAFTVQMTAKTGQLQKGFVAAWQELDRLKQYAFTQPELDKAKKKFIRELETRADEKDKTNSTNYVKEYQANFLNNITAPGIDKEYELEMNDVNELTLADLNTMPAKFTTDKNRDILIQAPESEKGNLPGEVTINDWIKTVDAKKIEPYRLKLENQDILAAEPKPGRITEEKSNSELGFTTLKLSNDVTVILKPTEFKNDEILFSSYSTGGTSLYPDADYQSAANAVGLIIASGAGMLDLTGMRQFGSDKQMLITPYITDLYQGVNGKSTKKDLESAMRVINAYFTAPRKDEKMFNNIITRSQDVLTNRPKDIKNFMVDTLISTVYNGNFRKTGPTPAKLKMINLDRSYDIYKERLGNASGMTFIFIGSFKIAEIKPLLEKYIGSLPSTSPQQNFEDRHINITEGVINKTVYKGSEPKAEACLVFSGPLEYSRQSNMELDALKEILQIRLLERLREDESGVYSPSVAVATSKYPHGAYMLEINFSCSPQNADKLIASTNDEIANLRTTGPSQVNIDKWKAEFINQMDSQQKENSFWLNYLDMQFQNDMQILPVDSYKQRLELITPVNLKEAANKYLSGKNYIRFVLMPENASSVNTKKTK